MSIDFLVAVHKGFEPIWKIKNEDSYFYTIDKYSLNVYAGKKRGSVFEQINYAIMNMHFKDFYYNKGIFTKTLYKKAEIYGRQ